MEYRLLYAMLQYNTNFFFVVPSLISARSLSDLKETADADLYQSAVHLMPSMREYTFHDLLAGHTYEVCLLHISGAPRLDNGRHCRLATTRQQKNQSKGVTR